MGQVFDTKMFDRVDRKGFWHDVVCQHYSKCEGRPAETSGFSGRIESSQFGPIELTRVHSGAISYKRTARDVRIDGQDDFFFAYMVDGEARFSQNGRRVVQKTGDVLLYDSGQDLSWEYKNPYSAILLRMKRATLESRIMTLDSIGGTLLSGKSNYGQIAGSLLENAIRLSAEDNASDLVLAPMLELLTTSFAVGTGNCETLSLGETDQLTRVKRFLLQNLDNGSLNLELVSQEQNMSTRTLSRLFAREGATPMGWLQHQRLAASYAALSEGRGQSVSEVAYGHGFNDLSHFGRMFKKTYGITPRAAVYRAN